MFEEIEKLHLEENISIKTFEMLQLKEKYAQLRIYYKTHEEIRKTVDKIIEKYVDKSTEICEKCGKPGELVKDYYLSIMCNDCKIQNKEERRLSLLCESLFYVNKDWYNSFID